VRVRTRKAAFRKEKFESGQERQELNSLRNKLGQGKDGQGLKARHILNRFTARLKSCPDTKQSIFRTGKAVSQDKIDLSQLLKPILFASNS
jgi:hypothetical protein